MTLLGWAARTAVAEHASALDLAGIRSLVAAGARPSPADAGPETSLMDVVLAGTGRHAAEALGLLLDAGLSADAPLHDGRAPLFHPQLTPEAARQLLAHGADRTVHDTRGGALDWSPVTYQADLRRWATAQVLLDGGVPRDHGVPPGSVLARVLRTRRAAASDDAAMHDSSYVAFMVSVRD